MNNFNIYNFAICPKFYQPNGFVNWNTPINIFPGLMAKNIGEGDNTCGEDSTCEEDSIYKDNYHNNLLTTKNKYDNDIFSDISDDFCDIDIDNIIIYI